MPPEIETDDTVLDLTSEGEAGDGSGEDFSGPPATDVDNGEITNTTTEADDTTADDASPGKTGEAADKTGTTAPDATTATPGNRAKALASTTPVANAAAHKSNQPTNQTQPVADPAKAFNDEKAKWGRERAEQQRKLQSFEQAESKRAQDAERMALRPFNPRHPDYQKTMPRIDKTSAFMAAVDALPVEQQNDPAVRNKIASAMGITADDAKLHDEFQRHRSEVKDSFERDPQGYLDQHLFQRVPEMIQDAFRQFSQHQLANEAVAKDMANPEEIRPHADFIRERLSAGDPYATVIERVRLMNRIAELEGKTGTIAAREQAVDAKTQAAQERSRLVKGKASVTRDRPLVGKKDIYAETQVWAKANSVAPGTPRFNKHVRELEELEKAAIRE